MSKKEKYKVKFICNKCGKDMPIDKKLSSKNFNVYETRCLCGGESEIRIEENYKT